MSPQSLIRLRSNDSNACKEVSTFYMMPPNLQLPQFFHLCCFAFFSFFLFFTRAVFPILLPLQVPLGLIYIISPKSTARYDGITLYDGWIWTKAAVRTGYLANVLSRPCPGTREEERERVEKRKRERKRSKQNFENTTTNSGVWNLSEMLMI